MQGIPLAAPGLTLVDLATRVSAETLEAAVNEADKRDLIRPTELRDCLQRFAGRPGVAPLRRCLKREMYVLTDSELERRFLRLVRPLGLGQPVTGSWVNGFKVDFHWPQLGLVVEADGLRYHRTPSQQGRDRRRDQEHARAGLTTLRFTYAQVRFEPDYVRRTLAEVAARLSAGGNIAAPAETRGISSCHQ